MSYEEAIQFSRGKSILCSSQGCIISTYLIAAYRVFVSEKKLYIAPSRVLGMCIIFRDGIMFCMAFNGDTMSFKLSTITVFNELSVSLKLYYLMSRCNVLRWVLKLTRETC